MKCCVCIKRLSGTQDSEIKLQQDYQMVILELVAASSPCLMLSWILWVLFAYLGT